MVVVQMPVNIGPAFFEVYPGAGASQNCCIPRIDVERCSALLTAAWFFADRVFRPMHKRCSEAVPILVSGKSLNADAAITHFLLKMTS